MDTARSQPAFVYRGTTVGWPGNPAYQKLGMTPATGDPYVATTFAAQARNFGPAVVQILQVPIDLDLEVGNCFKETEDEIVVPMTPLEFAAAAICTIEIERAIDILRRFDIECSARITTTADRMTRRLERDPRRLTQEEIEEFNRMCGVMS